jgi:integrase
VRLAAEPVLDAGFVFTTEFGEPCDPRNAFRALRAAATKAGLPHAGLHTLRHSAASVMLTRGVPLKVVSDILGHSSIAITGDIYGHVSPDVVRQAMDLLGDASTGSRSLSVTVQRASDAAPRACPSSSGSR